MKVKNVHPFPARMAPEIVLEECSKLPTGSTVLDPMCGSGTTLRVAIEAGHKAIGSDLDPLAVLVSKVNTSTVNKLQCERDVADVVSAAMKLDLSDVRLPWIDEDEETDKFIQFWFASRQIEDLRKIVHIIVSRYAGERQEFLKLVVSRLIFTKEMSASLARDTSHSRPHRVASENNFDVYENFIKSSKLLAERMTDKPTGNAEVQLADARKLPYKSNYFDAVITSPPYLNAIDYMRGSKLSLVWLGYKIRDLREIRSVSIGSERKLTEESSSTVESILNKLNFYEDMDPQNKGTFKRYVKDMILLMQEINRVLKPGGKAVLVVGNSCLKGVFVENTKAVIEAANICGLKFVRISKRELPPTSRYLPVAIGGDNALNRRMRTEDVISFAKS